MITTLQAAATAAIQVQDACNLTGVLRSFAEAMAVVREVSNKERHGTDWINRHPIAVMFADKIADMTGRPDFAGYSDAYRACQALAACRHYAQAPDFFPVCTGNREPSAWPAGCPSTDVIDQVTCLVCLKWIDTIYTADTKGDAR